MSPATVGHVGLFFSIFRQKLDANSSTSRSFIKQGNKKRDDTSSCLIPFEILNLSDLKPRNGTQLDKLTCRLMMIFHIESLNLKKKIQINRPHMPDFIKRFLEVEEANI